MLRSFPPSYQSAARSASNSLQTAKGVADFLRVHEKMASLLPTVARMAALQKDCAALLPVIFEKASVLQFESGLLVLSVPNAALAAKLKQQLPKLQDGLQKRNWQVNAVRLKLQPGNIVTGVTKTKQISLSTQALSALAALNSALEDSPSNDALKAAITAMLKRHRKTG